jgi:serine/threonine protein kinase
MNCVAEAVMAKGVRGLAEWVPGGVYLYEVAADALRRLKDRNKQDQVFDELRQAAQANFADAKVAAERVAREVAGSGSTEDRISLELYLSQIPAQVRKSLRRADDPSGMTIPAALLLETPDELLKVLPPQMPRFRPGDALPGRPGWTLVEPLGTGGFGEVWRATHELIPNDKAVKFCTDPMAKQRLLTHEGKLISRVIKECRGPNVVGLLDADLSCETPWLAYEYVCGGDLASLILAWQTRPSEERVKRATEALRVLAETAGHFHTLNPPIVHRDLKPANILVAIDGSLKITDFGIGGIVAQKALSGSQDGGTAYTRAASMLAGAYTPLYASPQQQRGEKADPRDDVHALGVIAYQMLTGRLDQSPGPKFDRHLRALGTPEELIELIGDCVDPEAQHRPKDGTEVARRCTSLGKPLPVPAPPEPQPAPVAANPTPTTAVVDPAPTITELTAAGLLPRGAATQLAFLVSFSFIVIPILIGAFAGVIENPSTFPGVLGCVASGGVVGFWIIATILAHVLMVDGAKELGPRVNMRRCLVWGSVACGVFAPVLCAEFARDGLFIVGITAALIGLFLLSWARVDWRFRIAPAALVLVLYFISRHHSLDPNPWEGGLVVGGVAFFAMLSAINRATEQKASAPQA